METLRTFLAIKLPDPVAASLGQVSAELAAQLPPGAVRWVQPERMHITLRFLGETADSKLANIGQMLDEIAANQAPFSLQLDKLGYFPNKQQPRIIWAGLAGDLSPLLQLFGEINQALVPLGWELEERPFRTHITLGRVKNRRQIRGSKWTADLPEMTVPITAVHLVESKLQPSGSIYTVRHTSHLQ